MVSTSSYILLAAYIATVATAVPFQEKFEQDYKENNIIRKNQIVHIQRREPNSNLQEDSSCNSTQTNDTIPAAFISGHFAAWATATDDYYDTHWTCDTDDAFVHGGMRFDNTEKSLYISQCGYYQVSSQVEFRQGVSTHVPNYAYHQLIVEPNCGENDPAIRTKAYASHPSASRWITSTYTGRVFKLCTGGKVYVRIPNTTKNACCPYGRGSFISAHLVQSTACPQSDEP